jgi:hypothetical protein
MYKKNLRGVAILTVLIGIALLMAIVTELSSKETIYYKLAINERDALQAEALAQSGANFAQLLLLVQEPLQGYLTNFAKAGVQMPAYTVWDLMPIDSDLFKVIADASFLPDFGPKSENKEKIKEQQEQKKIEPEKVALEGPYIKPPGGYGGFRGRFTTLIEDEEKKISLRRWTELMPARRKFVADLIFRILNKPENSKYFDGTLGNTKNISPAQLVANLYDYISKDEQAVDVYAPADQWGRILVGDKRSI